MLITDTENLLRYAVHEVSVMNLVLPKEHGAWAMLIVPFAVGAAVYELNWLQFPLFLGWFFLYLSSYPLLMISRNQRNAVQYSKWLVIYGAIAVAFLIAPLIYYPGLLWLGAVLLPVLSVNVYFARTNGERNLFNDFTAIAGLSLGAVASGYVGSGSWHTQLILAWLYCVLFFMDSVFFVKTMIRERGNPCFHHLSWGYHAAVVMLVFFLSESWALTLAYLPSLVRSIGCTGSAMTPLQIGKLEIANSMFFMILLIKYFN